MANKNKTKSTPKAYSLVFKFNGFTKKKFTDNLDEAIQAVKPPLLLTEMYVTAKKGDAVSERKLNLVQGRKLFNDSVFREVFINNLLLN